MPSSPAARASAYRLAIAGVTAASWIVVMPSRAYRALEEQPRRLAALVARDLAAGRIRRAARQASASAREFATHWPQHRLTILPDSEPQPDVVLLRYRDDFHRERKVGA